MKFLCPGCNAKYRIDDSKIPPGGASLRCKKCGTRIPLHRPDPDAEIATVILPDGPPRGQPLIQEPIPPATGPPHKNGESGLPQTQKERLVDQFVAAGDESAAAKMLYELIKQSAREKNFIKAESLRSKLYEVAPMALNEIVGANEIIEEEKSKSIDPEHLARWKTLYDTLENDEASELYYAMQHLEIPAGKPLFEHRQHDSNLYFLQKGELKMVHYDEKKGRDVVIKELFPGDVVNHEAFFSFTLCTTGAVAQKAAAVSYLEQTILGHWKEKFPGLEPKLATFCHSKLKTAALIEKAGIDLRAHPRHLTQLKAMIQLVDSTGDPVQNPFQVSLFDISAGGVSFGLKLNKRSDAAWFLGHGLLLQSSYMMSGTRRKIKKKGRIVAAHLQPFGESSIHVCFDSLLEEDIIADIVEISAAPAEGH